MPDIPLLNPVVLRGVVEKMTAPENLVMLNRISKTPWPYPTAQWDVLRGSRQMARPNMPNSEAHIVPRLGRSQESASFVYLREKKVFEPTTIHWIRTPGELAARNAEKAVMREVTDLNQRFDNFAEWTIWQMFTGLLEFSIATGDGSEVQASVDYQIPDSHKPTVSTSWASATPQQIRDMVTAWKRLVSRDGRVPALEAFLTEPTLNRIVQSFTANQASAELLSDRMKDTFFSTGTLPGFLGLNWTPVEHVYETSDGTQTLFLPDDSLVIGNLRDNNPMELIEGPSADDDAPDNYTGKFAKTWKDKDPSARQYLLEWHFLPVLTRPEQLVYVEDVAP